MGVFKELILGEKEKLEGRASKILHHACYGYPERRIFLTSIDATGLIGNKWTQLLNGNQTLEIGFDEIEKMLKEDGQIIDGSIEINSGTDKLVEIRFSDGVYLDVVEYLLQVPDEIVGDYKIITDEK